MELSERYIKQLESEDFASVYEWQDPAGTVYEEHEHQGKTTVWLTDGSITFDINGEKKELKAGDRFDVPPKTKHTAVVGPEGWIVIVGEE
jgi:quercetin dioxygenase-like cupin family protein